METMADEYVPQTPPLPQPTTPPRAHWKEGWKVGWKAGWQAGWQTGWTEANRDALAVPQTPPDLSPPEPQPVTPVFSTTQPVYIDAEGWTHVSSEALDLLNPTLGIISLA
jgi:hypothetical protein